RCQLAADRVGAARAALDAGDRAGAMREAGRALALDPASRDAAAVVGRLMLEPPAETPPELAAELAAHEDAATLRQGRPPVRALASYVLFVPFLFWLGVRDWTWVGAFYGAVGVALAQAWLATRAAGVAITPARSISIVLLNAVLVVALSRVFGPYVLVPALA